MRPVQPAHLLEPTGQECPQGQEVFGIGRGICQHGGRQRPVRPVGALPFLGETDTEMALQQRGQTDGGFPEQLSGDPGIEQVLNVKPVVAMEGTQVIIRVVEHRLDLWRGEEGSQGVEWSDEKRIDDRRRPSGRDLDEIDTIDVAVEARGFRIHGHDGLTPRIGDETGERGARLDEDEVGTIRCFCQSNTLPRRQVDARQLSNGWRRAALGSSYHTRATPMEHVMERIRVGDTELVYEAAGTGPAVVFLHGLPMDRRMWRAQLTALPRWRCIVPDLRGLGQSQLGERPVTMRVYADDIAGMLDGLGIERAVVCGLSMGGYVTFEMLRRHAGRVRALVLADTRAEPDNADARRAREDLIQAVRTQGSAVLFDRMGPRLLSQTTWRSAPQVLEQLRLMASESPVAGATAALGAARDRVDSRDLLPSITQPTLVLVGRDDVITPPESARRMAASIAAARLVEIGEAGHVPPLEQPERVTQVLREFLESLVE